MKQFRKGMASLTALVLSAMLLPLSARAADEALLGDVNADGAVNAKDATIILIASAKMGTGKQVEFSQEQMQCADVNKDGYVNAKDAAEILQYAALHGIHEAEDGFADYMRSKQEMTDPDGYTPQYDSVRAYWLDMSKASDFIFNGEFLVVTFQIRKEIQDGHYPLTFGTVDIASWKEVAYEPHVIDGEIAVGCEPAAQEALPVEDFTLKINSVSAKQGDTVTVCVDVANNPGFCGFVINLQYDANAMTVVEAGSGKDYEASVLLDK